MQNPLPSPPVAAPIAPKKPHQETLHGITRTDDYFWLKDPDWQEVMRDPDKLDPEIRTYLEAENDFTEAAMAPVAGLRETLVAEMKGRIKEDDSSVPAPDGMWTYGMRYREGGQHPVFCRYDGDGSETVLLDGDAEADGHDFFRIGACVHSPDHSRLAWSVDLNGSELFAIRIRDIASGKTVDAAITGVKGDVVWGDDGSVIYYTLLDDNHRPYRVNRHVVGGDIAGDEMVYEEEDAGFFVDVGRSEDRQHVLISAHDHTTSEIRLIDVDAPETAPRVVAPRTRDLEYDATSHGDTLYILTNADGAEDFKIVTAPLATPGRENWTDLVPHRAGTLIRGIYLFRDWLVRLERVDALPRIVVREIATGDEHEITFDEEAYDLGASHGYEFATDTLRFTYSSMTTPMRVYDYDMRTRERTLRKEQEIPSGHDPERYVTRRIQATSHDGERVPVTLLYATDTPLDGSAPCLLYGYGSYGFSMPASFSTNRFSLVDRGFVYAIAHIRGGTEKGYGWYLNGKLDRKPNTFHDFIAAGEALVEGGFTSEGRIAIHGGSAGGMLVGATVNMRPDLLGAVIGEVPFVDVLNTMCDAELPLTPPEWPEWGNPIEDADAYASIAGYSPYDNVVAKAYPHILATGGLTDPRVTYWEPAKWVAKLRALRTDGNLTLLHINMQAGHAGAAGRFDKLDEVARVYAFVLMVFGLAKTEETA